MPFGLRFVNTTLLLTGGIPALIHKTLAHKTNSNRNFLKLLEAPESTTLIALILICIGLSFASPYFLTTRNVINILRQISLISILATGQAMVVISGGIDLSVGALVGLTACLGAVSALAGAPPLVTLLVILGSGALVGLTNGLLITKIGLPPFIATLGMLSVLRGFSLLTNLGSPIHYDPTWVSVFGGGYVGIIPLSVIVMITIVLAGHIFMKHTVPGRNIYAVGNSEKAAKLSGIDVDLIKIWIYTITGFLGGICGMVLMGQMDGSDPFYGSGYEMEVIAAVVIGGMSLSGGQGNLLGLVLGAALMGVLKNAFVLLAVPGYWQTVAIGIVIIASTAVDSFRIKKAVR